MKNNSVIVPDRFPWRTVNVTPDRFWLTGKSLAYSGTNAGTEYIDTANNIAGYRLAESQSNVCIGAVPLPPNWGGKYTRMSVAWLPAGATSGNVRFGFGVYRLQDGTALAAAILAVAPLMDAASGAATTPVITTYDFATALPTAIGPNNYMSLACARRGDLGADDTYAGDIYVVGVGIELR